MAPKNHADPGAEIGATSNTFYEKRNWSSLGPKKTDQEAEQEVALGWRCIYIAVTRGSYGLTKSVLCPRKFLFEKPPLEVDLQPRQRPPMCKPLIMLEPRDFSHHHRSKRQPRRMVPSLCRLSSKGTIDAKNPKINFCMKPITTRRKSFCDILLPLEVKKGWIE